MARCFAFFTLFHLSLTFFRPEVPFKSYLSASRCFILYMNEAKLGVITENDLLVATLKRKIQVQRLDFAIWHLQSK